jgi:peptidoglycan L-alanyl-D-glutamate endopeptidase CwlK
MSTKLEDLQPDVQFKAREGLTDLADACIPFVVTSTLRTLDEQIALYAQGRQPLAAVNVLRAKAGMAPIVQRLARDGSLHSDNDYTVTNCDGWKFKSNHQSGRALDITPEENGGAVWPDPADPRWKQIADVMKRAGFAWGGDWPQFPDYPHYEMV